MNRMSAVRRAATLLVAAATATTMLAVAPLAAQTGGTYVDVAAQTGLDFTHSAGEVCDPFLGVGSAWADYDGDGDVDGYATNRGGANAMWENVGDTNADGLPDFVDTAAAAGIDSAGPSHGAVFVDFDNDGDQDLYVTEHEGNVLYRNDGDTDSSGDPNFTDVTATAGLADGGRAITASWGDYDNDGYLDVYLSKHRKCNNDPDAQDHLFHNDGDGTFTDVSDLLCPATAPCDALIGLGFTAGWFDADADGDQDLYLINDAIMDTDQPNKFWLNEGPDGSGGWIFTEVSAINGTDTRLNGMGLGVGDYDNDGDYDVAFSNAGPAELLENVGDTSGDGVVDFIDASTSSNVESLATRITWATAFFDHDNDGDLDLFFGAGEGDTGQFNVMLDNNGDKTFSDISRESGLMGGNGLGVGISRHAAMIDFDADGWLDLYIGNYDGVAGLYRNDSAANANTNNSMTITVEGTESNRDGIGTELFLATAAGTQMRLISSGPTHGGGDQRIAHFGLGSDTSGDLTIRWPNGVIESLGTLGAGAHHFVEPSSGDSGSVAGHVFSDGDGDGVRDAGEPGLAGVTVSVVDADGTTRIDTTDSSGDYLVASAAVGSATVTFTSPANHTLTTGNATQTVTITNGGTASTADVGYQPDATPTGGLIGHVFEDNDGDGTKDGAESGLAGVTVTVVDADGASQSTSTNSAGEYTVIGLAVGTATASFTTPADHTLTTGNATQTVTITGGGTASTTDVGFQPDAIGPNGDLTGYVFHDIDGNGIEDGADSGLAGATVTATDSSGTVFTTTTDSSGTFNLVGLATGNATVSYSGPGTVTTGNATQSLGIVNNGTTTAAAVGFLVDDTSTVDIIEVVSNDHTIDPGQSKWFTVLVTGFDPANGTFSYSGTGVTVGDVRPGPGTGERWRIETIAASTAMPGPRDLTVTMSDGASDTLADAITVTGDVVAVGTVVGHVFEDVDGNGVADGTDTPLAGVDVTVTGANGAVANTVTDLAGDFTVTDVVTGDATVTFTAPADATLTTGNDTQTVTVTDGATVAAADVGYQFTTDGVTIVSFGNGNAVIRQGRTKRYQVVMTNYVDGGSFSFTGTGLTVLSVSTVTGEPDARRLNVSAAVDAPLGSQDLVVVSGDGSTATYPDAIAVVSPPQQTIR